MRKTLTLTSLVLSLALALAACDQYQNFRNRPKRFKPSHQYVVPRCQGEVGEVEPLAGCAYIPTVPGTCIATLPPFDVSGWWEANMNSRRLTGREVLKLGCLGGDQGCHTVRMDVDFTKIQEDAEIIAARLAVYVVCDQGNMARSMVRGRVNVGGDYAVVGESPVFMGQWVLYDITEFARRCVLEQRNAAGMEINLACGDGFPASVATVALGWTKGADTEPKIVLEYR